MQTLYFETLVFELHGSQKEHYKTLLQKLSTFCELSTDTTKYVQFLSNRSLQVFAFIIKLFRVMCSDNSSAVILFRNMTSIFIITQKSTVNCQIDSHVFLDCNFATLLCQSRIKCFSVCKTRSDL